LVEHCIYIDGILGGLFRELLAVFGEIVFASIESHWFVVFGWFYEQFFLSFF
jgi:hypothetical protein